MTKEISIVKAFIDRLGNVEDWYFTGQINELPFPIGICVCGHQIKFEYIIKNRKNDDVATIGSECIYHFKEYNQELYEALIEAKEQFKEKRLQKVREKRDKENYAQIKANVEEAHKIKDELVKIAEGLGYPRKRIPYELWSCLYSSNGFSSRLTDKTENRYKSTSGILRWSERNLETAKKAYAEFGNTVIPEREPEPKFEGTLWFGKYKDSYIEDVPVGYLKWLLENWNVNDQRSQDMIGRVIYVLDKKRKI